MRVTGNIQELQELYSANGNSALIQRKDFLQTKLQDILSILED